MREAPESSDAELITLARAGDADALGSLFARHLAPVTAVARAHARDPIAADDLAAEAFARTFRVLRSGGGPDVALRAYLYTAVRRLAAERARGEARVRSTAQLDELDRQVEPVGADLDEFDREVIAKAFLALPERWRAVLWHVEVERMSPAAVAPILGLSANAVSALAYRAREGLREQYLQQHIGALPSEADCRGVAPLLGAHVRGRVARRDRQRVDGHLRHCERCTRVVAELRDAGHGLRAVVAPLVLGATGLGALPALAGGDPAAAAASVGDAPDAVRRSDAHGGADAGVGVVQTGGQLVGSAPARGVSPGSQGLAAPALVLSLVLGVSGIGAVAYAGTQAFWASSAASPAAAPATSPSSASSSDASTAAPLEPAPSVVPADGQEPAGDAETPAGPARLTVAVRTIEPLRPGAPGELVLELGNAGGASRPVELRAVLPDGARLDASRPATADGWSCAGADELATCTAESVPAGSTGGLLLPVTLDAEAGANLTVRVIVHEGGALAAVGEGDAADPAIASARRP